MIIFLQTEVTLLRVHTRRMRSDTMTEGSIWKKILIFSIPLILGNLLQQMYNTVDSMIVGNFVGSNALAAVGSGTAIINLLISFSQGAEVGAGIVVANYYGAQNDKQVQNAVHTSLGISLVLGLILSVLGVCFTKQLLIWMNTPAEVMADSISYMRLYSAGLVFNIFYNMAAGILNAVGNSRRSLIYLGAASVTNIVLDLVLIAGFHMGVEGAAIATDISQAVSGILALGFLMKVSDSYRVNIRKIGLQKKMASSIIRIGLPAGIQNMVISFSNVLFLPFLFYSGNHACAGGNDPGNRKDHSSYDDPSDIHVRIPGAVGQYRCAGFSCDPDGICSLSNFLGIKPYINDLICMERQVAA